MLVWVLWSVAVLSLLVVHLCVSIRQDAVIFKNTSGGAEARLLAEAGVKAAMRRIKSVTPGSYYETSQGAGWVEGINAEGAGILEGRFEIVPPDGSSASGESTGDATSSHQNMTGLDTHNHYQSDCGILDAGRWININRADRTLLARLFLKTAGLKKEEAVELAGAVVDYRDADDKVSGAAGEGGSEESVYRFKKLSYSPKDADFETETELLRVPGMTAGIYQAARPWITVFGDGRVNLNTALPEVLALTDLNEGLAGKILALRSGPDGQWQTSDDEVFRSLSEVESALNRRFGLTENERLALHHAITRQKISVGSEVFLFSIRASTARGQAVTHVAYHLRTGVSSWNEN